MSRLSQQVALCNNNALEAAKLLESDGISARVIDMYSVKPLTAMRY